MNDTYTNFRKIISCWIKRKILEFSRQDRGCNNVFLISKTAAFSKCKMNVIGSNNKIIINEGCSFNKVTFFMLGNNNVINISENVCFYRGGDLWIEDDGCLIEIGKDTTIEEAHIAVTEPGSKISIGEDCMFAYDIDLRTGDSHSIIDSTTNRRINYARNVIIGDHVWIAAHSSILKGADIAKNSVIATRSVVTKPFSQEGAIIGGNPAVVLKNNIVWDRSRIYE